MNPYATFRPVLRNGVIGMCITWKNSSDNASRKRSSTTFPTTLPNGVRLKHSPLNQKINSQKVPQNPLQIPLNMFVIHPRLQQVVKSVRDKSGALAMSLFVVLALVFNPATAQARLKDGVPRSD